MSLLNDYRPEVEKGETRNFSNSTSKFKDRFKSTNCESNYREKHACTLALKAKK